MFDPLYFFNIVQMIHTMLSILFPRNKGYNIFVQKGSQYKYMDGDTLISGPCADHPASGAPAGFAQANSLPD